MQKKAFRKPKTENILGIFQKLLCFPENKTKIWNFIQFLGNQTNCFFFQVVFGALGLTTFFWTTWNKLPEKDWNLECFGYSEEIKRNFVFPALVKNCTEWFILHYQLISNQRRKQKTVFSSKTQFLDFNENENNAMNMLIERATVVQNKKEKNWQLPGP